MKPVKEAGDLLRAAQDVLVSGVVGGLFGFGVQVAGLDAVVDDQVAARRHSVEESLDDRVGLAGVGDVAQDAPAA